MNINTSTRVNMNIKLNDGNGTQNHKLQTNFYFLLMFIWPFLVLLTARIDYIFEKNVFILWKELFFKNTNLVTYNLLQQCQVWLSWIIRFPDSSSPIFNVNKNFKLFFLHLHSQFFGIICYEQDTYKTKKSQHIFFKIYFQLLQEEKIFHFKKRP